MLLLYVHKPLFFPTIALCSIFTTLFCVRITQDLDCVCYTTVCISFLLNTYLRWCKIFLCWVNIPHVVVWDFIRSGLCVQARSRITNEFDPCPKSGLNRRPPVLPSAYTDTRHVSVQVTLFVCLCLPEAWRWRLWITWLQIQCWLVRRRPLPGIQTGSFHKKSAETRRGVWTKLSSSE